MRATASVRGKAVPSVTLHPGESFALSNRLRSSVAEHREDPDGEVRILSEAFQLLLGGACRPLAQPEPLDLAGQRARELVDELHEVGVFVSAQSLLAP